MIPATLALVPCVVVRSGEQFYCFDSAIVTDRGALNGEQQTNKGDTISWRGEQLRLLRLPALLGELSFVGPACCHLVVLGEGVEAIEEELHHLAPEFDH